MKLAEKYNNQLELIRQDFSLLNNYRFDENSLNSNHYERLRVNIAIYNDLKDNDFEIAKFLFKEEVKWRKLGKDGEVDNFYFSAYLLTLFKNPEIIWLFLEGKNIDFDSGIGFDGEYLVSCGIDKTYKYVNSVDNPLKTELFKFIRTSPENCNYSQKEIDSWHESKREYFRSYQYPILDEQYFLYSTNERCLFLANFPDWISQQNDWNYNKLGLFRTYAKYSGDKLLEIESLKLTLEKNDKEFLVDIYKRELAILYIDIGDFNKAFDLLKSIIKGTDNSNIIRDCIEQLCVIVRINQTDNYKVSENSYDLIISEQKKYRHFSPHVDNLIIEVSEIIEKQKITAHNK